MHEIKLYITKDDLEQIVLSKLEAKQAEQFRDCQLLFKSVDMAGLGDAVDITCYIVPKFAGALELDPRMRYKVTPADMDMLMR